MTIRNLFGIQRREARVDQLALDFLKPVRGKQRVEEIHLQRPKIIVKYSHHMGGVDLYDHMM